MQYELLSVTFCNPTVSYKYSRDNKVVCGSFNIPLRGNEIGLHDKLDKNFIMVTTQARIEKTSRLEK